MKYVNSQLDERFALFEGRQAGPKEKEKKQVDDTTDVMMIEEIPTVPPPQENPSIDFNQTVSKEVTSYLMASSEDEKIVLSAQWLMHQMNTNMELIGNEALAPILNVEVPRNFILKAIMNYHSQMESLEGREKWEPASGVASKAGQNALQQLTKATQPISKMAANPNLPQNIKTAAKNIVSHLLKLKATYNKISNENEDSIMEATNGTMTIPKRDLKAMIATLPNFSGEDDKEWQHGWNFRQHSPALKK